MTLPSKQISPRNKHPYPPGLITVHKHGAKRTAAGLVGAFSTRDIAEEEEEQKAQSTRTTLGNPEPVHGRQQASYIEDALVSGCKWLLLGTSQPPENHLGPFGVIKEDLVILFSICSILIWKGENI